MPSGPVPVIDLERDLDALYQGPLEGFVAARDRLASDLRRAGRREEAALVKSLAKPSQTAWAVNQAWWTARAVFTRMLASGADVLTAQRATLTGQAANLREAIEARQHAIDEVVDVAARALGGEGGVSPAVRQRLASTCDALATGEPREDVRPGRLSADLQPAGFATLGALLPLVSSSPAAPSASRSPSPGPSPALAPPPTREAAGPGPSPAVNSRSVGAEPRSGAREALVRAERVLADAERDALHAREAVERAQAALDAVSAAVVDLEARLSQAREEATLARRALVDAKQRAEAAEEARIRAERGVRRLRATT